MVNLVTLERGPLPGTGTWELIFEDGWGAARCKTEARPPVFIEDVFNKVVLKDEAGKTWVEEQRGRKTVTWCVEKALESYQLLTCSGHGLGSPSNATSFECLKFVYPRSGFVIFWNAGDIYKHCKMTSYEKKSSKWWYNASGKAREVVDSFVLPADHVLKSRYSKEGEGGGAEDEKPGFAPFGALSTLVFVIMMIRWSCLPPKHGGFRNEVARRTVSDIATLIVASCLLQDVSLPIRLEGWIPTWPCQDSKKPDLHLRLCPDGNVSLEPLTALAKTDPIAHDWWEALVTACPSLEDTPGKCSIVGLLKLTVAASIQSEVLLAIWLQLVWQVSATVESAVRKYLADDRVVGAKGLARLVDLMDLLNQPRSMDRELVRFVRGVREASRVGQSFSLSCDKANVGGMSLHNGIVGMGSNVVALAVPQASDSPHTC